MKKYILEFTTTVNCILEVMAEDIEEARDMVPLGTLGVPLAEDTDMLWITDVGRPEFTNIKVYETGEIFLDLTSDNEQ